MTKLIKISLISAMLATSGFAQSIAELENGGKVEANAEVSFGGQTLTVAEDKILDVYGSLTGTGNIKCSGDGKVNIHINKYQKDDTNKGTILSAAKMSNLTVHTLDETGAGSISETITVTPEDALNKVNADLAAYASGLANTDLVYIANAGGSDTNCIGSTETTATEISAALANADTEASTGFKPSGLVMTNKLTFSGDNSGFTQKTVRIGTTATPAEVEYAAAKSIFPVETTVDNGSTLTISSTDDVELSNNLTVNGSAKVLAADPSIALETTHGTLNITGKLIVKSGTTLTLGRSVTQVKANTYDYPQVMTWPANTFRNEMNQYNKIYYTVTHNGDEKTIWYNEFNDCWGPNYVDYAKSESYIVYKENEDVYIKTHNLNTSEDSSEKITLGASTSQEISCFGDTVFSYTYEDETYNRICKYQVFPAGVDKNTLDINTSDKSTWLIIDAPEASLGSTHVVIWKSSSSSLGAYSCKFNNNIYAWVGNTTLSLQEGNSTVGYWTSLESTIANSLHASLKAGNTFMTLADYNTANETSYKWTNE